jgi:hypothetical protein
MNVAGSNTALRWSAPGSLCAFCGAECHTNTGFSTISWTGGPGPRVWQSEISSIDTAILLCGVLSCRQQFADAEVKELATKIYDRMDWQWLFRSGPFLSHGWTPERGFLNARWDTYSEHMMLYLLAIGARNMRFPLRRGILGSARRSSMADTAILTWRRPCSSTNIPMLGLIFAGSTMVMRITSTTRCWRPTYIGVSARNWGMNFPITPMSFGASPRQSRRRVT